MEKLVSVLMCVYNTPVKYLKEAVNSICVQSYKHLEFVIVDDCSDKMEVIDYLNGIKTEDARIRLIKNRINMGLTKSLNIGLKQCKGDYIARMDADDVSAIDRLETQVSYMENHPDVALTGGYIELIGEDGSDKQQMDVEYMYDSPEMYVIRALVRHPGPAHPTFMFRTSFLYYKQILYDESIRKGQDYNIITQILQKNGKVDIIKKVLLCYRVHIGQITATSEREQLIYQSRTSYKYLKSVFPKLSEPQRAALSTICWYEDRAVLEEAIRKDEEMNGAAAHLITYQKDIENPKSYCSAIKLILANNKKQKTFDQHLLKEEFHCLWWKKAARMSKEYHRIWGMGMFAIRCYIEVLRRKRFQRCVG